MAKTPLHPKIFHLTPEEVDYLIAGYMAGTSATVLVERFNISISANQLQRILPADVLEQSCSRCGASMIQSVPKRRQKKLEPLPPRCSLCGHEEADGCRCQGCLLERVNRARERQEQKNQAIAHAIRSAQTKGLVHDRSIADVSLTSAVAFLALSRCCPVDAQLLWGPLAASPVLFAPTSTFRAALLKDLITVGLIALSERSAANTIFLEDGKCVFDAQGVKWVVSGRQAGQLIESIELAGLSGFWPEQWSCEVKPFWHQLALAECREFYDYCGSSRGLQAQGDSAVNHMLANLLRDYSVSQAYRVIWHGAKDAADFLVRKRASRAHAANFMVEACQRWADRARAEGWNVVPFKRNFELPRSMVSYVLFDVVLRIGEGGFNEVVR